MKKTKKKFEADYEYPWLFNNRPFLSEMINGFSGFVYCITNNVTGMKYIGRKYFFQRKRKKSKNAKRGKIIRFESDWKEYWSSSDLVIKDVEKYGKESFTREIISLHTTQGDTNYFENFLLFLSKFMEEPEDKRTYYNNNIMNRYYYNKMKKIAEKRLISNKYKKLINTYNVRSSTK